MKKLGVKLNTLMARSTGIHLEVKAVVPSTLNTDSTDTTIGRIMEAVGGEFLSRGTMLGTNRRDFIYGFKQVPDETALIDRIKDAASEQIGAAVAIQSFAPGDAYPGDATMFGYPPDHLVRQSR